MRDEGSAEVDPGRLRAVELFAGLTDQQLEWLATQGRPLDLADGTVLFEDGEEGRYFYVLLSGELLITKMIDGREHVMSRHVAQPERPGPAWPGSDRPGPEQPGPDDKPSAANQYTGELPMLAGGCYVAKGTAVGRTELIAYDRPTFLGILARCPQVCQVLLPVLAWRIRSYERQSGRNALLEGLGTIVAGLMHELNNPVAAAVRAAGELITAVVGLTDWAVRWGAEATAADRAVVMELVDASFPASPVVGAPDEPVAVGESAESAEEITDILAGRGIAAPAELAFVLADCGVEASLLSTLDVRPEVFESAVNYLAYSLHVRQLAAETTQASHRIEAVVDSARNYANADRAPCQEVNLAEGLEATLVAHAGKLSHIQILREYAEMPPVLGYPSELNQVWGNLVDNAADAMKGSGELRLRTFREGDSALVEIGDNGPGIPPDVLSRLFQPFYTTKDIGKGSGLGLYLSRDIVVHLHNGSIDVTSVPGNTRVTVRLPLKFKGLLS